ncbi:MAG: aldo/keto reductase [Devosia sp.]
MPDWRQHRTLGSTYLSVSGLCIGTSPLGSMPDTYGYAVEEERAVATVRAVLDSPINFLDTSNAYGAGRSEQRIGAALRATPLPAGFVIATKVDADPRTGDFSGERVMRSFEESLERMGLQSVDLLHLHDPEFHIDFDAAMAPQGAVNALVRLRESGRARYIGVATGTISVLTSYVETGIFDVVLNHNRYTLVDRSAEPLMEACARRNIGFINGAPYGGGILARGSASTSRYGYAPAHPEVLRAVKAMEAACARHGVPLAAAALQFSLRNPVVASTVVGLSSPARLEETAALADVAIAQTLWDELETLAPPRETWLA